MNFCSRSARLEGSILPGTGVRGDVYVFLPVPKGAWGASELNESWATAAEIEAIRSRRRRGVVTRLYNPTGPEAPILVHGPRTADAEDLLALFAGRWAVEAEPVQRLAVCTQGTRDRCCAKWGFAVFREARALFESGRSPFEPIECSHLGGDRYAATGVFFPSGSMYAHLDGADLQAIASGEAEGLLSVGHYRGRVFESPLTQIVRAGLARDGHGRAAAGRLQVSEPAPGAEQVRAVLEAEGRAFTVSLATAENRFYSSCDAMDRGRVSRARRVIYAGARPES